MGPPVRQSEELDDDDDDESQENQELLGDGSFPADASTQVQSDATEPYEEVEAEQGEVAEAWDFVDSAFDDDEDDLLNESQNESLQQHEEEESSPLVDNQPDASEWAKLDMTDSPPNEHESSSSPSAHQTTDYDWSPAARLSDSDDGWFHVAQATLASRKSPPRNFASQQSDRAYSDDSKISAYASNQSSSYSSRFPNSSSSSSRQINSIDVSTDLVLVNTGDDHDDDGTTTPAGFRTSPKFAFLSEEKATSNQLKQLQKAALRRRHEFQSNVHELELRVASITAALAQERMERDRELKDFLTKNVYQPLEIGVEEVFFRRPPPAWLDLEARLTTVLDTNMTRSIHVDLETSIRTQLDSVLDELEHEIQPIHKLETHKADKREGTLFRRFEELVGVMARRFQEERATRMAVTEMASRQMKSLEGLDQEKAGEYLEKIIELRQRLDDERAARKANDKYILGLITVRDALMKEVMLDLADDEPITPRALPAATSPEFDLMERPSRAATTTEAQTTE